MSAPLDTPFAEIAVDVLNVPADKTYHYAIPDHLRDLVAPGIMVLVGFGDRIIEGLVVSGSDTSPVDDVREIMDVVAESALLTPAQIALARRISKYYLASPMKVIGPMLPPGLRERVRRWSRLDPLVDLPEDVATTPRERLFLETLRSEGEVAHDRLKQLAGPTVFPRMQRRLERLGAVHLRVALNPVKPPPLRDQWVESLSSTKEAEPLLTRMRSQRKLLQALESTWQGRLGSHPPRRDRGRRGLAARAGGERTGAPLHPVSKQELRNAATRIAATGISSATTRLGSYCGVYV